MFSEREMEGGMCVDLAKKKSRVVSKLEFHERDSGGCRTMMMLEDDDDDATMM